MSIYNVGLHGSKAATVDQNISGVVCYHLFENLAPMDIENRKEVKGIFVKRKFYHGERIRMHQNKWTRVSSTNE